MGFKLEQTLQAKKAKPVSKDITSLLQREVRLFGQSFGNKRKEDFYTEMGVLLKAGIHLKEALTLIGENEKKEKWRTYFEGMVTELVAGKSLSEVVAARKDFSEYEYYSMKIGEETGTLARVTEELGRYFTAKNEQRRALVNALTYPLIILFTAILVVVFMLRMVVPMFEDIFRQNGVELPGITRAIIGISGFLQAYGGWLMIGLIVLVVLRGFFTKKIWFRRRKDQLLLRLPYVGNFVSAVYLAQFTRAVALLTASKLPLLNSIQLVRKMIPFYPLKDALEAVEEKVLAGQSLHESMKGTKIFNNKMISLVKVAEETNQTEFIFERLNGQYAIEVQQKSKMLSTIMEPLIIVIVGVFVGVILVSLYLPMFRLSSVLG